MASTKHKEKANQENAEEAVFYSSITLLPLCRFIDIVVDEKIKALIISGDPTYQQLLEAWSQIGMQYADAIKDNEYRMINSLEKEVNRLKITHTQIIQAIKILKDYYTIQFATELNKLLRTSFKFDVRLPDDYNNDLKRSYNRSKGILIDLNLKQAALDGLNKKLGSDGKKPTKEYFQAVLITLSDHVKYPVREDITVFEYCDRIRRLNQYNETIKNKK